MSKHRRKAASQSMSLVVLEEREERNQKALSSPWSGSLIVCKENDSDYTVNLVVFEAQGDGSLLVSKTRKRDSLHTRCLSLCLKHEERGS